jgi:type II secretory pathway component PulC
MFESGSRGRKKSAFSEFIKKNKSLVYLLPILVVVILVAIILKLKPAKQMKPPSQPNVGATTDALKVEVLPQMERVKPSEDIDFTKTNDPFSTNEAVAFSLKGVLLSEEKDAAIIETGSRTYIVSAGDSIGSYWVVEKIDDKKVTLIDRDGNDLVITLK